MKNDAFSEMVLVTKSDEGPTIKPQSQAKQINLNIIKLDDLLDDFDEEGDLINSREYSEIFDDLDSALV